MTSVHHRGQKFFFVPGKERIYGDLWARTQKQASAQAAALRTGALDQSLTEILKVESNLMALKEQIVASAN